MFVIVRRNSRQDFLELLNPRWWRGGVGEGLPVSSDFHLGILMLKVARRGLDILVFGILLQLHQ